MRFARCDGAARVRSPRLLQSGIQCLCVGSEETGVDWQVKQVALRRAMDLEVCGNFPRPSLGRTMCVVAVTPAQELGGTEFERMWLPMGVDDCRRTLTVR